MAERAPQGAPHRDEHAGEGYLLPSMAAASPVKTSVTELPESRVRVRAEVASEEVERRLQQAARALGRQMRIPGFRQGKVPPLVVIRRLGREAVLDEALRSSLGGWYAEAIEGSGIAPVGSPEVDVGDLPAEGAPLQFSIEIGVRPEARLGRYRGLEVGRREPQVSEQAIGAELERLRERVATLENVERPAKQGDHVLMDYVGMLGGEPFAGGEGSDQLLELGAERLIPGFEEGLVGAAPGERRTVTVTFPEDYGAEHLAGREAAFEVTVKEVKAKRLPELDDDLASEAAGLDTLSELREDIARRLREVEERAVEREFEEAVLDAAVAQAQVELPERLVHARAHEMLEQSLSALARQGIAKESYLQIMGKDEEELAREAEPEAATALRREAVLAAVAQAEGIEPTEDDLREALRPAAERSAETVEKLLERLRSSGRLEGLREDVAQRQALELMVREARPIAAEQAQARKRLWTPEKGSSEQPTGDLWTPGS